MNYSAGKSLPVRGWLASLLVLLLIMPCQGAGQQPPSPLPTVQSLKLVPLAGNNESNDLERKIMAPLVVEVLDQYDRPVEGADVVFRFPLNGPGAFFADHSTSRKFRTNFQGQAAATGWVANNEAGTFEVHVTATYGNQVGETTITMSNATRVADDVKKKSKSGFWSSRWTKIAIIGGAAAVAAGVILATRGGSKSAATVNPPITITPGTPTVGGPH